MAATPRVVVIDDERHLRELLELGLAEDGFEVKSAPDGRTGLQLVRDWRPDAIVLDVMLPGQDGLSTCRSLRDSGVWSPVLMLTARDTVENRVAGLDAGADDYLVKPFSFAELLARLRALSRRVPAERPVVLKAGDLRLDPAAHRAWRGDTELQLSSKEFALLESFMRRPGQALSRLQLLESAWDLAYETRSNLVDVYVGYLRQKIDRPFGRHALETVRHVGYRLREDGG